jgi:hypothetical protein
MFAAAGAKNPVADANMVLMNARMAFALASTWRLIMKYLITRCLPFASLAVTLSTLPLNNVSAANLATFDFEDVAGNFEVNAETQHAAVASALFSVEFGTLTHFAGNPGRALAANAFNNGNRVTLTLVQVPGQQLTVERVRFDMRVSPSGPQYWRLDLAGAALANGPTTTQFTSFDIAVTAPVAGSPSVIDFVGMAASSQFGTLRLDNISIEGSVSAVALPPSALLLAAPLIVGALRRRSR